MIRLWRWITSILRPVKVAPTPMTVQQALAVGIAVLKQADIPDPARDARLLMAACLDVDAGRLTLHVQDSMDAAAEAVFMADVQHRAGGQPMSHLLGYRDFWSYRFKVTPDVLDPRGDTETLIEAALAVPFRDVLDLGTGSGCIVVTLLAERQDAVGVATDISKDALRIAESNAKAHGVLDRCAFERSNWFEVVEGTYDLVVSNPPYIARDEMSGLGPELSFEPRIALTDEGDGLSCYRIIAAGAPAVLRPHGWLMVEIGPTQGPAVVDMFTAAGFKSVQVRTDLDGRNRVVLGQKPQ